MRLQQDVPGSPAVTAKGVEAQFGGEFQGDAAAQTAAAGHAVGGHRGDRTPDRAGIACLGQERQPGVPPSSTTATNARSASNAMYGDDDDGDGVALPEPGSDGFEGSSGSGDSAGCNLTKHYEVAGSFFRGSSACRTASEASATTALRPAKVPQPMNTRSTPQAPMAAPTSG